MATNILSRFLPPATGEPSIYETLRQHDELDNSDIEERAGMAVDEGNLGTRFRDYDDDATAGPTIQTSPLKNKDPARPVSGRVRHKSQDRARTQQVKGTERDELDDEVPQSLLIEGEEDPTSNAAEHQKMQSSPPVLGPTNRGVRAKWRAIQQQQRLYQDVVPPQIGSRHPGKSGRTTMMDPKEKALWMWTNVENLDNFLAEIYEYYTGNGIWSITLTRMLNLLLVSSPRNVEGSY